MDESLYSCLPGTEPGEFVPLNMTPLKSNLAPGREIQGCHPSRWLFELIQNDFTACDIFQRAKEAKLEAPYAWQHEHKLVINGNQSFTTSSTHVLSSVCLDCHFHFVFKMSWDESKLHEQCSSKQASWPVRDSDFFWHHIVWAGSDASVNIERDQSKYYPLLARENFVCSAPPCTFQLVLEVSEPRMAGWWIDLLNDHDAIRQQLKKAKEDDPSRYDMATDDWVYQAPLNLNTYLKNLLETSPEDIRSISKRNKRFAVLFGPRCFNIFHQLEFKEEVRENDDIDEGAFTPLAPAPPSGPSRSTELGTYRGYLEDVRAEVQCLIHRAGQAAESPTFCSPILHASLKCQPVPEVEKDVLVNLDRYKLMGTLPGQLKEVVVNAYKRQWDLMPNKRRELLQALLGIANDVNNIQLSDFAMTQSSIFESQLQNQSANDQDGLVPEVLNFFGLQPPNTYSADDLIKAYRQKVAKYPGEGGTARDMLLLMAQSATSDTYQEVLLMETSKMSLATSKAVLGIENAFGFDMESVENARKKVSSANNIEEKKTYISAMEAIADHVNSNDLKREVAELRAQNGIEGGDQGVSPIEANRPVNYELPVGLENIGNTCYLNSLLQYLFTVKPVREIVLNYEDHKLELEDGVIEQRRLGGNKMQMDRGEAVVAQAFAHELCELFRNLQSSDKVATRPSQRLANAVLLSTHTLLKDPKPVPEAVSGPEPPPLPKRPSLAPPSHDKDDVDMVNVSVNPESDLVETASTISSRTLVDQGDADSDRSYEKIEPAVAESDTSMATPVIESFRTDVSMSDASQATSQTTVTKADADEERTTSGFDINMTDNAAEEDEEVQTVDQKVLTALEHQKRSSGTDQQDVEEVMGSILNRLQAAIRPSSIDESTGIQLEKIMETFFVTTVNYTKKFDESTFQKEVSFDRSITAFPAPGGPCSLYDALGRNFDQQILEESKLSRYTAIKTLPPVLHVLIQRTQSMGSKNGNPVVIPETLYLDRYMDAPHDSPEFKKRIESWVIGNRIADIKAQKAKFDANGPTSMFLDNYEVSCENKNGVTDGMDSVGGLESEENFDFDGPVEDDFLLLSAPNQDGPIIEPPQKPQGIQGLEEMIRTMADNELHHREETLEAYFASLQNVPYRLHAVICHRGQLMSGHYWVWIHDFEKDVWHKYNDSDVEANKNTEEVLKTLSSSGEPYYLCYVRDGDKDQYVDVPKRRVPESNPVDEAAPAQPVDGKADVAVPATEVATESLTKGDDLPPSYEEAKKD